MIDRKLYMAAKKHSKSTIKKWYCITIIFREDPKEGNDDRSFDNITNETLTPANFSRAFFKSASREIPVEVDRQSNQPTAVHIFDVLKDVSVFHFSASTPV